MEKVHKFTLDVDKGTDKNIEVVTQDYAAHKFEISLVEHEYKKVDLTDTIVRLIVRKPDGATVQQDCTIVDTRGEISVLLMLDTINVAGNCKAEIQIFDSNVANKRFTSAQFNFKVRKSLQDDETVESTDQFSILQSALEQAQNINEKIQNKADLDENGKVPLSQLPDNIGGDEELRQEVETARGVYASLNDRLGNTEIDVVNLGNNLDTHLAKSVADIGGAHGLDVETGIFTPYFYGSITAGANTHSTQIGRYLRIGKLVFITIELTLSLKGSDISGVIRIGGLPFTAMPGVYVSMAVGSYGFFHPDTNYPDLSALVLGNFVILRRNGPSAGTVDLPAGALTDTSHIRLSGAYLIN